MLTSAKVLFDKAYREKFALPSFNTSNLEVSQGIILGAAAAKAPIIIAVSETTARYAGFKTIVAMVKALSEDHRDIPFSLHLDHGKHYKTVTRAIKLGFNSVQIDGSRLPYGENVRLTKKVTEYAHEFDVPVQGELAKIPKSEEEIEARELEETFTDPGEARQFVEETGVDTLAVAVGTAHGLFKGKENLDLDRLRAIHEKVPVPLVLHGSSGVPDAQLKEAVKLGVVEVNIDTVLREQFVKAIEKAIDENPEQKDPRKILVHGRDAVKAEVERYIKILGADGKSKV
jgi:ketose-bisphosphate aldolase